VKAFDKVSKKATMENNTVEEVRMVTLDDMLSAVEVLDQAVGIIGIDVQGAEGQVLRGAEAVIRRHRPFIMYEDTELADADKNGQLFARILAEMGPRAPQYEPCYCERDCLCRPRLDGGGSNRTSFDARWWGPGSSALARAGTSSSRHEHAHVDREGQAGRINQGAAGVAV